MSKDSLFKLTMDLRAAATRLREPHVPTRYALEEAADACERAARLIGSIYNYDGGKNDDAGK